MKLNEFSKLDPKNIVESLQQDEYYVWTVHFQDGTSTKVKIRYDETSQEDLERHFKKPIAKIDYSWGIQGGQQFDQQAANQWHRDQDEIEKQQREIREDDSPIKPGDQIRTKKMQMDGVVEKIGKNRAGYDEVFFKIHDGRVMKTPLDNVSKVEKLNDEDDEMLEGRFSYDKKTASMRYDNSDPDQRHSLFIDGKLVKTYGSKEEAENVKARDPRYRNAEVKKTVPEGMMGGINRSAPAQDVSYENMLDEQPMSRDMAELVRYEIKSINNKIMKLHDLYIKFKAQGDQQSLNAVKTRLAKLSAEKSKLTKEVMDECDDVFESVLKKWEES